MDLICVDCQAGYYTAGRFVRGLECSECGGALAVAPEGERATTEADAASPAVAEAPEASTARW